MSKTENTKLENELLNFYDEILEMQVKLLKETYVKAFSNIEKRSLNELYMTYYAKVCMQPAFVYFLYNKVTKLTKIGKSTNPFKRLKELNSLFLNHFGLTDSLQMERIVFVPSGKDYKAEKLFHEKFSDCRIHGEWFKIDKSVIWDLLSEFISYDTDGLLENEGFDDVSYKMIDEFNLHMFALDSIKDIILQCTKHDEHLALKTKKLIADKLIYKKCNEKYFGFLNFDVRTWDCLFSKETQNKTWEMFKWLFLNKNSYTLSSFYHIGKDGQLKSKIIGFDRNAEILSYYTLVEDIINKSCYMDN